MNKKQNLIKSIQNEKSSFTKKQLKFAKYLLSNNIDLVIFSSIENLSKESGVSTATINRFCKKLGYKGFYDFKNSIKNIYYKKEISFSERIDIKNNDSLKKNIFYKSISNDKKALNNLILDNPIKNFKKSIKLFLQAKRIYFCAHGSSSFSAQLFCYYMMQLENNVINLVNEANYFEKIIDINSNDLLVLINLPFYVNRTIDLINYAKSKKCKIILITDSPLAPGVENAEVTFLVEHETLSFLKNYTAINALINALITALVFEKKESYKKRLDKIYDLVTKSHILKVK